MHNRLSYAYHLIWFLSLLSRCPQNILLVQRQVSVNEEDLDDFRKVLKSYVDATSAHSDNLHVSVQKLPGKSCYIMYEFWQDRISWMSYLQSNSSKDFQRCIIDMLEDPEVVSTMLLPGFCYFFVCYISEINTTTTTSTTNNNDNFPLLPFA
uniref:ABM domain-containing protein n=1 Tax=Myripristis murdjan TaxID=586833 RepID=A0A667Z1S4_9TELE